MISTVNSLPFQCRVLPFSLSLYCTHCHTVRFFEWNLFLTIVVRNLTITLNKLDELLSFFQNTLWNHDKLAGPIKITPYASSHQLESKYVDCLCLGRTIITATTATSSTTKRQSHSLAGKTSGKLSVQVIDRQAEIWKPSQNYSTSGNADVPKLGVGVIGLMYFKFCENCETQRNPKEKRRVQYSSKFKRWTIVAKTIQYSIQRHDKGGCKWNRVKQPNHLQISEARKSLARLNRDLVHESDLSVVSLCRLNHSF